MPRSTAVRQQHSGYKGSVGAWKEVLSHWQAELAAHMRVEPFDFHAYQGQSQADALRAAHPNLPKSLLDFVAAGGMHLRSLGGGDCEDDINRGFPSFLPAQRTQPYAQYGGDYAEYLDFSEEGDSVAIDEAYFRYEGDNLELEPTDFPHTFIVGEEGPDQCRGVYLLNPLRVSPDGEWEGWYWYPARTGDARRYASFAHLVAQKYTDDRYLMGKATEHLLYFDDVDWSSLCMSQVLGKNWTVDLD